MLYFYATTILKLSVLLMQVMITFIQFQELNLQILLLILRIEKIIQMLRI